MSRLGDTAEAIGMADRCAFCRRPEEEHPIYDGRGGPVCTEWMATLPWENDDGLIVRVQ